MNVRTMFPGEPTPRVHDTTDAVRGVEHELFQTIVVGTPHHEDGSADLRHVLAVARSICTQMNRDRGLGAVETAILMRPGA
jgi:UDP-glucose 6-dehydrogenase